MEKKYGMTEPRPSEKAGTPTMGGLIIIMAVIVPVLLFAKLNNVYVLVIFSDRLCGWQRLDFWMIT